MSTAYKRFSSAYKVVLGISAVGYWVLALIKPELKNDENNLNPHVLLIYAATTVAAITAFHKTKAHRVAYILLQIIAVALTASALAFLVFVAFTIFTEEDGNLPVTSIMVMLLFITLGTLFFLIRDKNYRADPSKAQKPSCS